MAEMQSKISTLLQNTCDALHWALDIIDMYDIRLAQADSKAQVYTPVHLAAKSKARGALHAAFNAGIEPRNGTLQEYLEHIAPNARQDALRALVQADVDDMIILLHGYVYGPAADSVADDDLVVLAHELLDKRAKFEGREATWSCRIGLLDGKRLPSATEDVLREAVRSAFVRLTGMNPDFVFSGWDGLAPHERQYAEQEAAQAASTGSPREPANFTFDDFDLPVLQRDRDGGASL